MCPHSEGRGRRREAPSPFTGLSEDADRAGQRAAGFSVALGDRGLSLAHVACRSPRGLARGFATRTRDGGGVPVLPQVPTQEARPEAPEVARVGAVSSSLAPESHVAAPDFNGAGSESPFPAGERATLAKSTNARDAGQRLF